MKICSCKVFSWKNGLKARVGAKKSDGTDLTLNTEENAIAKTLGNRFAIPLDFEYFKQPVSPYYLHKDLVVTIELNKPEKVMLCSNDASATYTISDIVLEYDAVIDAGYTEKYLLAQQNSSYPYTRLQDYPTKYSQKRIICGYLI